MRPRMLLVDYIGNSDPSGRPLGHPLPALRQYRRLLDERFAVRVCAPANYTSHEPVDARLPFHVVTGKRRGFSTFLDTLRKLANTLLIPGEREGETFLFTNVDIMVAVYCLLRRKRARRWVVLYTLFEEGGGPLRAAKCFLLRRMVAKVDLILCSSEAFPSRFPQGKALWIPDFIRFGARPAPAPGNGVVLCIGTMNREKDLEGLIRAARSGGFPLRLVGRFHDPALRAAVEACAGGAGNISIEDRYLDEAEFDAEFRACSYVCLPYRKDVYLARSSGILLDALFRGKPVIAPRFGMFTLVEENGLGMAYDEMEEIAGALAAWSRGPTEGFARALEAFLPRYESEAVLSRLLEAADGRKRASGG